MLQSHHYSIQAIQLLAPNDTSDGTWIEKAVLIVVQVRSDLVLHTG